MVKKSILAITVAIVVCSVMAGFPTQPLAAAIRGDLSGGSSPRTPHPDGAPEHDLARPVDLPSHSCANPLPIRVRECEELEQEILSSTVRWEWRIWMKDDEGIGYTNVDSGAGHATIKEGRYLVTHNHTGIPLSEPEDGVVATISVFAANGQPIWEHELLELVTVAAEDAETLVLDFGVYDNAGLFAMYGLSSAEFRSWQSLPLQPGMEVAQIDWDGEMTQVDWVTIDEVITKSGPPRLQLDNFVMLGASGGGVFWHGYHVANTWTRETVHSATSRAVLRRYSVAALNSSPVVTGLR